MSEHVPLQPSSAHRWVECPGSVQAERQYPDRFNPSVNDSIASQWVADEVLRSYRSDTVVMPSDFEGAESPNGVIITEELIDGAEMYVNDVLAICQKDGLLSKMKICHPVKIDRVHADNRGVIPCMIWAPGRLIVWMFSMRRIAVENHRNWELIEYAIGALDEVTGGNGLADQNIVIEMRVVQPRAFHIDGPARDWRLKGDNLRGFANQLRMAAEESQQDDPPTQAGHHCRDCTARRGCATLQNACAVVTEVVEVLQLHDLSPADTAVELRYLRKSQTLLNERLKGLESQALEQAKAGTMIPGFGIGYGRGSIKWIGTDAEVVAMGELMGVDLRKPETPCTPTQAKKKNLDEAVINSYSQKHKGSATLVEDDKTIAGRVFGNTPE